MLGSIAVEKEIYACETAQICVGLHIGDLIPLGECSYTSHSECISYINFK